ncbi:MAG: apolipoprotein N-acyltransferase [Bacteroidetes bacterium]|nr:apolipoprotein N-acyltransferase [Bacteroidota bacterium]
MIAGIAGLILGFSFPPSPFYTLAYIAFFPLFWIYDKTEKLDQSLLYTYIFLLVFHITTLYWVGGFVVGKDRWMMIAGGVLLIVHPLLYLPFVWLALVVRKKVGRGIGYVAFIVFWITFEYLHSLTEYAFPWIIIGNSQAYDSSRIQIVEFTSVYGLSFIILMFNCLLYELTQKIITKEGAYHNKKIIALSTTLLLIFLLPYIYGISVKENYNYHLPQPIKIAIVQANIDPWQKWDADSTKYIPPEKQVEIHLQYSVECARSGIDLLLWPETAIPIHIFLPRYSKLLQRIQNTIDSLGVSLFTGLPTYSVYSYENAPVTADRLGTSDVFIESYNSTVLFDTNGIPQTVYRKNILVPFAERIPYAEVFKFLIEPLKWNVGISSWGKGTDTTIFEIQPFLYQRSVKFASMICYESVFPQYVRAFVKRGAEFLIVVTNDSWWGNTSGAYQHAAYTALRAVETRRWIVQAANGGISLVIDPTGTVQRKTELFQALSFTTSIYPMNVETFYVHHGDLFAKGIVATAICLLLYLITKVFWKK